MITVPVSKDNSHVSIKSMKHLSRALRFIPIISKNYALSLQHLQDRKRPPRLLSSIPNNCVQPHNCCLFQKFPQNIHCTHMCHRTTSRPPSQNECFSEARKQPAKRCPWTLYLLSQTFLQLFFPNSYTSPKRAFAHTLFTCRASPTLGKATPESSSPNVTKAAASPSQTFPEISGTRVNS